MTIVTARPAAKALIDSKGWGAALFAACTSALFLAILIRALVGHPPTYDELLHVLAARGIAATGEPAIADGIYARARVFTELVYLARGLASDEAVAARLPAVAGALLLVSMVAGWTVRQAGLVAGTAAGMLLAASPWTINLAVFARFYTLHALAIFVAFAAAYELAGRPRDLRGSMALLAVACAAFALAIHLQVTSVIALGAAVAGLAAGWVVGHPVRARALLLRHRWSIAIAGPLAIGVVAVIFHRLGFLQTFQEVPLWAASSANRVNFYNAALARDMPLVWPLMPFAALAACLGHRRLGWTLLVVAAIPLIVHSLAASKSTRYVYYALPMVCIIAGVGVAEAYRWLSRAFQARLGVGGWVSTALATALLGGSVALSQEGYKTLRLAVGADSYQTVLTYGDEQDWSAARAALVAIAGASDAVVTTNSMKTLYYVGRYDYEINASIVPETDGQREFGLDPRTGRRAISSAASLEQVLAGHGSTLIVAENEKVGVAHGFPADAVAVAERRCSRAEVAGSANLTIWRCLRSQ